MIAITFIEAARLGSMQLLMEVLEDKEFIFKYSILNIQVVSVNLMI